MGQAESSRSKNHNFSAAGITPEVACHNLEMLIRCKCNDDYRIEMKLYWDLSDKTTKKRLFVVSSDGKILGMVRSDATRNSNYHLLFVNLNACVSQKA